MVAIKASVVILLSFWDKLLITWSHVLLYKRKINIANVLVLLRKQYIFFLQTKVKFYSANMWTNEINNCILFERKKVAYKKNVVLLLGEQYSGILLQTFMFISF